MTFKETDFPGLIKFLKSFITEESDPVLVKDVVLQLVKLYEEVPLYPGIAGMCIGNVVKVVDHKDVQVGEKIYIQNGKNCYFGTVVGKSSDGIKLKEVKSVTSGAELEIEFGKMGRVRVINERVLEELWPSLMFDKKQ